MTTRSASCSLRLWVPPLLFLSYGNSGIALCVVGRACLSSWFPTLYSVSHIAGKRQYPFVCKVRLCLMPCPYSLIIRRTLEARWHSIGALPRTELSHSLMMRNSWKKGAENRSLLSHKVTQSHLLCLSWEVKFCASKLIFWSSSALLFFLLLVVWFVFLLSIQGAFLAQMDSTASSTQWAPWNLCPAWTAKARCVAPCSRYRRLLL